MSFKQFSVQELEDLEKRSQSNLCYYYRNELTKMANGKKINKTLVYTLKRADIVALVNRSKGHTLKHIPRLFKNGIRLWRGK